MVKIQHKQTGEVQEVSRHQWETSQDYHRTRFLWKILDEGDPVMMYEITSNQQHRQLYKLDRDHASRMIKSGKNRYFYKEITLTSRIRQTLKKWQSNLDSRLNWFERHPIIRIVGFIVLVISLLMAIEWVLKAVG